MNTLNSGLSINQRNIYMHYLAHKKKHGNKPCKVPKSLLVGNRLPDYLKAIQRLEEKGLFRIERPSDNYLSWTILDNDQ